MQKIINIIHVTAYSTLGSIIGFQNFIFSNKEKVYSQTITQFEKKQDLILEAIKTQEPVNTNLVIGIALGICTFSALTSWVVYKHISSTNTSNVKSITKLTDSITTQEQAQFLDLKRYLNMSFENHSVSQPWIQAQNKEILSHINNIASDLNRGISPACEAAVYNVLGNYQIQQLVQEAQNLNG